MAIGPIVIIVIFFGGNIVSILLSDRKRRPLFKKNETLHFTGRGFSNELIFLAGTLDQIRHISTIAMNRMGIYEIDLIDTHTILGWTPISFSGIYTGQQIVIHIEDCNNNGCSVRCCSRPRFAFVLGDLGRAKKNVSILVSELSALTDYSS